jgi:hypothetical protein
MRIGSLSYKTVKQLSTHLSRNECENRSLKPAPPLPTPPGELLLSVGESILSGGGDPPPFVWVFVAGVGEKPSCLICGLYWLLEKNDMVYLSDIYPWIPLCVVESPGSPCVG